MAENTSIEWCHHTFNHVRGCTKVSPGCTNCYADTMSKRNPSALGVWGPDGTRVVAAESYWKQPLRWDRQAAESGERLRVFCASLADIFERWNGVMKDSSGRTLFRPLDRYYRPGRYGDLWWCVPERAGLLPHPSLQEVTMDDCRRRVFDLSDRTPHLDWLFLTKRPERIRECWPAGTLQPPQQRVDYWQATGQKAPRSDEETPHRANAWLGTTVENRDALPRIDELRQCRDLSPVLFLSCEPLLEDLGPIDLTGIDWVIAGGESGPKARVSHPQWYRNLRDQCIAAGVAFLFKQWGEYTDLSHEENGGPLLRKSTADLILLPTGEIIGAGYRNGRESHGMVEPDWRERGAAWMSRVGKKAAGRELDGREWNQFPPRFAGSCLTAG